MAKVLDALPPPRYRAYDQYLDGRPWRLEPGKDFTCSVQAVRTNLSRAKRRLKLAKVTVQWIGSDNALYVMAHKENPR